MVAKEGALCSFAFIPFRTGAVGRITDRIDSLFGYHFPTTSVKNKQEDVVSGYAYRPLPKQKGRSSHCQAIALRGGLSGEDVSGMFHF